MKSMTDDERVRDLREDARRFEDDPNPRVAYFAKWCGYWMDAHARAMEAWRESIGAD